MSEDPDEATIKRRSENAEVAMQLGCLGIELLGIVTPVIAVVMAILALLGR